MIPTANVANLFGTAVLKVRANAEQKLWLFLGYTPEQVRILLNVVTTQDEGYKQYTTYFFNYYVKYLDEPLSPFSPKIIQGIWSARLYAWLDTLTPPQVFTKLGFTGPFASARGKANYIYM